MEITDVPAEGYERVVHGVDAESGLNAFVAVHCTTLGPGCGGLRMLPYESEEAALSDALRLARAMTYKSAVAATGLGGGKAVIFGDPQIKSEPLLRAMGRLIDSLGGQYITAEDMNIGIADLEIVRLETPHVAGLSRESGSSGNPSPMTARGVHTGLRACAAEAFGDPSLRGRRIAIQGVGAVGGALAEMCAADGAELFIEDINEARVKEIAQRTGATILPGVDSFIHCECDIISPCARGGVMNDGTIPQLKCRVVAGAANNQLLEPRHGDALKARGILYAPDYVINAGGIINIGVGLRPQGYDEDEALRRTGLIGATLKEIFQIAKEESISTNGASGRLAERRIEQGRRASSGV